VQLEAQETQCLREPQEWEREIEGLVRERPACVVALGARGAGKSTWLRLATNGFVSTCVSLKVILV
jgi:polynucleotide 5'-kinase involved in rRNA processing